MSVCVSGLYHKAEYVLPAGEDRFGLPRLFSFFEKIFLGVLAMGRSEIGVSEEEKRKPSKSRKQFNEIFQINFAEVLAKPDSEFGVSEREKC